MRPGIDEGGAAQRTLGVYNVNCSCRRRRQLQQQKRPPASQAVAAPRRISRQPDGSRQNVHSERPPGPPHLYLLGTDSFWGEPSMLLLSATPPMARSDSGSRNTAASCCSASLCMLQAKPFCRRALLSGVPCMCHIVMARSEVLHLISRVPLYSVAYLCRVLYVVDRVVSCTRSTSM